MSNVLKLVIDRNGYPYVNLYKDGKSKCKRVHQLVGKAFIPNPDNKEVINHINREKIDNTVDNLEWVTLIENTNHINDILRNK